MSVDYRVGDTRDLVATIPDGSVDLVCSSPPFLALRSYIPQDHESKHQEIGSEKNPAEFIDMLLGLTAEWGRVLAPHGSIAIELGDTHSGSGGAGGDYADNGWRKGQAKFGGSASRSRPSQWSEAEALWFAGVIDTEGSIYVHRVAREGKGAPSFVAWVRITMMDREVCDRAAEIAGVGKVTQDSKRGCYTWASSGQQARYVLTNIWPHLLIKQRQAKAAIELARHIEETGGRGSYSRITPEVLAHREMIKEYVTGLNGRGDERGVYVPTWEPPTPPRIQHSLHRSIGWPRPKSLALIPQLYAVALAYGINPLTGQPSPAGRWLVRNVIVWHRPNPSPGALGDKVRPSTSYIVIATRSPKRWFDLTAVRTPGTEPCAVKRHSVAQHAPNQGWSENNSEIHQNPAGAPPLDAWFDEYDGSHDTWTLTTQPSRISVKVPMRVPCGPDDGGERTTSPDCPVHGDQADQVPTAPDGEPVTEPSPHTSRTGDHRGLVPQQFDACDAGTSSCSNQTRSAATRCDTESSRTDLDQSTSVPGTPSAQTVAGTPHTPESPESFGDHPDTSASSSGEVCPPVDGHETAPRSDHRSDPESACTCTFHLAKDSIHSHYAMWPAKLAERLVLMMCPSAVCRICGEPRRRVEGKAEYVDTRAGKSPSSLHMINTSTRVAEGVNQWGPAGANASVARNAPTLGWTDCGCGGPCGEDGGCSAQPGCTWCNTEFRPKYRPGLVLDPFCGSGTTMAVADLHGRDAIGIDFDARNKEIYPARYDEVKKALYGTPAPDPAQGVLLL